MRLTANSNLPACLRSGRELSICIKRLHERVQRHKRCNQRCKFQFTKRGA